MADGLYTIAEVLIADHIRDVLPITSEANRVENKLMDGTPHVQTIGTPMEVLTLTVSAEDTVAETIDGYAAAASLVKVYWIDRWASGYIREVPTWKQDGYRYYTASMDLLIVEQGDQ
jgi:hypothetical protein